MSINTVVETFQMLDEEERTKIEELKKQLASVKSFAQHFDDLVTALSTTKTLDENANEQRAKRQEAMLKRDEYRELAEKVAFEISRRELDLNGPF